MANFILILLCLCAGIFLRSYRRVPESAASTLNAFVIYLSLPALVLVHIPALLQNMDLGVVSLIPASMAWLQLGLASLLFFPLARVLTWTPARTGALVLTAGLGNTSFVGFPMLEVFLGREGVQVGVLVDQLGSFLAVSTLGLLIGARCSGTGLSLLAVARRVVFFPPFIGLLCAFAWYGSGTYGPGLALSVLESLAITLVPIALVAVGLQLKINLDVLQRRWGDLVLGLGFKLIIAPAFLAVFYIGLLGAPVGIVVHATILEAAMAPMVTGAIVASEYRLDSEIASLMVGVGIPLSLVTVLLWDLLLRTL